MINKRDLICIALTALALGAMMRSAPASAKTPGETYCFKDVCHRVKTVAETAALVGKEQWQLSSFYGGCETDPDNPCGLTSSGEVFDPAASGTAASPIFPNGTVLELFNPGASRSARVRVNNSGPYFGERLLDVSRATAEALGFVDDGLARLRVTVLSAPSEPGQN